MYRYSASAARDLLFSGTAEAGALPPAEWTGVLPISIGLPIVRAIVCAALPSASSAGVSIIVPQRTQRNFESAMAAGRHG